jgi:ribose-phosphate pyrophosphokinase
MIFCTSSANHFVLCQTNYGLQKFSDGELSIHVSALAPGTTVWVVASTYGNPEHFFELMLLLDSLARADAIIHLFLTYFMYGRQVTARKGEACSAQVMSRLLKTAALQSIHILHPHSQLLHTYLDFNSVTPLDFFCQQAAAYDAIAAPGNGAHALAQAVASKTNKEYILLEKIRPLPDHVSMLSIAGNPAGKKILLVDDIIATGRTLVHAAELLKQAGAESIAAAATHGILCDEARRLIEESYLDHVTITTSINQYAHEKIHVVDLSSFIREYINYCPPAHLGVHYSAERE